MQASDGFWNGLGQAVANMPSGLLAVVMIVFSVAAAVYSIARSKAEALSEKESADNSNGAQQLRHIEEIGRNVNDVRSALSDIKTEIAIIKDRVSR